MSAACTGSAEEVENRCVATAICDGVRIVRVSWGLGLRTSSEIRCPNIVIRPERLWFALENEPAGFRIRAFGEHKGPGPSLMCELLAGALTGSGTAGPGRRRVCNGMLSIYVTPRVFGSDDAIAAEARTYLDFLKSARPAPGAEVPLPGEPQRRTRAQRLAEGVPLPEPVCEILLAAGRPHGLDGDAYRN